VAARFFCQKRKADLRGAVPSALHNNLFVVGAVWAAESCPDSTNNKQIMSRIVALLNLVCSSESI
jgi:hypothetical protein